MISAEQSYLKQSVLSLDPIKLVVKMYDLISQSCYREDKDKVIKLLSELIHHLNFEYDISTSLFGIYNYCQNLARESKFEEIQEIIEPLRITWQELAEIEINK